LRSAFWLAWAGFFILVGDMLLIIPCFRAAIFNPSR
jgi:hypothetical protein